MKIERRQVQTPTDGMVIECTLAEASVIRAALSRLHYAYEVDRMPENRAKGILSLAQQIHTNGAKMDLGRALDRVLP